MTWLQKFVEAHSETESPQRFWYWAGLSIISASLRNNIFLNRFIYTLYPNTYVFLTGPSGIKKGPPINVAKTILNQLDCTRVVSGRNSIQQVLNDFSKPYTTAKYGAIKSAHGILIASELAAFLVKDPDALTVLTDIYDSGYHEKEWKYSLRSGIVRLIGPCISLLGGTNEEHFDEAVPHSQVGGGFVARTFIIYSDKPGILNSLIEAPKKLVNLMEFVPFLAELSQLKGEMKWTEKGKLAFDSFYHPHMTNITTDKTGTLRRLPDQILKVAMLLALSDNHNMYLEVKYLEEAIIVCEEAARESKVLTSNRGKGQMSSHLNIVLRELVRKDDHTRDKNWLIKRFWQEGYTTSELDIIIETLSHALHIGGSAKNPVYTLKDSVVKEYEGQLNNIKRKLM